MTETLVTSATIQTTTILFIDDAVGVVKNRTDVDGNVFQLRLVQAVRLSRVRDYLDITRRDDWEERVARSKVEKAHRRR